MVDLGVIALRSNEVRSSACADVGRMKNPFATGCGERAGKAAT